MAGFWKNDQKLEHNLKQYVAANRRLRYFGIHYIDCTTPLEVAREDAKKNLMALVQYLDIGP